MWMACYLIMKSFMQWPTVMTYNDARKGDWNNHWSNLCTCWHSHFINYFFYHLPTRGREGIKLGDMLIHLQRIYNIWSIHDVILSFLDVLQSFYSNFISFFGTDLLTQCPVAVVVFFLFFTSQKIKTKWSTNAAKLFGDFFWTRRHKMGQRSTRGVPRGGHNPPWRAWGPRHAARALVVVDTSPTYL